MAQKRHFWKEGVNESLRRWGLGVTLPATKIGLALVFLGSEICVVKKVPKKAIFRTLRCRQLGRRGLNRKTKSTNRFFGPNYPPVQNFSEKNDKKFLGTLSVFLYHYLSIFCSKIGLQNHPQTIINKGQLSGLKSRQSRPNPNPEI